LPLRVKPRRRFFRRLGQILADCRRRGVFFIRRFRRLAQIFLGGYPQIPQISADYGGLSCRCASSHAAGFFPKLRQILADCRRRGVFFIRRFRRLAQIFLGGGIRRLRRLAQILSGMSCRCASSHAAGFFADWGRFSQIAAAGLFPGVPWPHACVRQSGVVSHAAGFCKLLGNSCISDLVNNIHHLFGPK
jgi:hypothetical protein